MDPLRVLLLDVSHVTLETSVDMLEYPIGLLYVGTALKEAFGDRIELRIESYEHKRAGIERVDEILREWRPDLLGMRALTMGRRPLHEIARLARDRYGVPVIVAGGPHASDNPAEILADDAFDAAAVGEGENTAVELVGRLLANGDLNAHHGLDGIAGLAVRGNGGIELTPRPFIQDLDSLPIPDHSLVDFLGINRGHVDFSFRTDTPHANLFTSRGCPYHCVYCHQVFGKRMRSHSAERIMEEVKRLNEGWGITRFQIIDDIFNLDRARAMKFLDMVVREDLDLVLSFPNGLRGDRVDAEMIDAMWEAGTRYISYAIESGSPRIQKLIQKNMKLDRIREAIALSTAKGIVAKGYFMLGFPTETEEEALQSVKFANESDLVLAMFFSVVYFPGTPLYRMASEVCDMGKYNLGLEDDYVHTREGPYDFSRERLAEIKRQAIRDFFFSPKRVDIAYRVLPGFFCQRDFDASMLTAVISSEMSDSELDPAVAERLHRYFLIRDRFSTREGFFV
jgi:radical SAM superfamily enzyme YgiQ (UPF0313 family)